MTEPERPADWVGQWEATRMNAAAADEEARTPRWLAQQRIVEERLGGFAGLRVIEIGAGRGTNAAIYAKRGAHVTLLDNLPLPLEQAREAFAAWELEAEMVVGDAFGPPPELLGAFDVSMSFGLCEHFVGRERRAIVAAHLALLRPGGIAFIGVPNRLAPAYRLWMAMLKQTGSWPFGTEEPYTAGELARLARAAGGEPLAASYGSFVHSLVDHGLNQLLYKLGRPGVNAPQTRLPVLDRFAYELLVPIVRRA